MNAADGRKYVCREGGAVFAIIVLGAPLFLKKINFTLEVGEFLAILGDGGSGKSGKSVRLVSKPKPEGMTKEVCCVNYEAVVGLKTVK